MNWDEAHLLGDLEAEEARRTPRCIQIGTTTVQGTLVRELPDGMAQVRVGEMVYTGQLIDQYQGFAATASGCKS
jgi:hypothetical protein